MYLSKSEYLSEKVIWLNLIYIRFWKGQKYCLINKTQNIDYFQNSIWLSL